MRLTLDETVAAAIAAHGEHGYPHEVCGLLLGRFANDGEADRNGVVPARERACRPS